MFRRANAFHPRHHGSDRPCGSSSAQAATPTFSKDVAPILYKNCVECHRPGAIAPMSLMTYDDARPWARAIKQKVMSREMPPWGADPHVGKFANDPSLSARRDRDDRGVGGRRRAGRQPGRPAARRRPSPKAGRWANPI